jgi:aerobic-type carbon monoxide dehydrogenase small subunit (CoxS/CutS family)
VRSVLRSRSTAALDRIAICRVQAVDGQVTTIEGLTGIGRLHPVHEAIIDEQAVQCGYCTSGMVISAVGLLRDRPDPTEHEVREALDGNLCRCGAHGRIVRAVLKAAGRTSGGQAVVPHPPPAR